MPNAHTVKLNDLRIAPRKVRLIADVLRGMAVNEAEARLSLDTHRAARPLLKLLRSAVAGARAKELNLENLYVSEIRVDQGHMLKRYMPRAQGRGVQIQKKYSHIILGLSENPNQKRARFTMPEKRVKAAAEDKKPVRKPKAKLEAESKETEAKKETGFLKRTFRRKSGEA